MEESIEITKGEMLYETYLTCKNLVKTEERHSQESGLKIESLTKKVDDLRVFFSTELVRIMKEVADARISAVKDDRTTNKEVYRNSGIVSLLVSLVLGVITIIIASKFHG